MVAYDFGIKRNILRRLAQVGCRVTVVPALTSAEDVLALEPDGVFLSNGPGDPEPLQPQVANIRKLIGKKPIFGICLGHQLLGLALGGKTYKLKFGHRGANHPVRNELTSKVEITSHNHGFAVDPDSLNPNEVELTHVNLNDQTLEGFRHRSHPVFCVQYHPEAAPGPHDSHYLFDDFVKLMRRGLPSRPGPTRPDAQTQRHPPHPDRRLRPHRHRPGLRVRLLRHAGRQGAARRRLRSHAGQFQPGHHHDGPGPGRPDLRRAADAWRISKRSSAASGPTRCSPPWAARPA